MTEHVPVLREEVLVEVDPAHATIVLHDPARFDLPGLGAQVNGTVDVQDLVVVIVGWGMCDP